MTNHRSGDAPIEKRRVRISRRASAGYETPDAVSATDELRLAKFFVEQPDEYIVWIGTDGALLYGDPDTLRTLGFSAEEFSAMHVWDIFPMMPESWPARFAEIKRSLTYQTFREILTRSSSVVQVQINIQHATLGGKEYLLCGAHRLRTATPENAGRTSDPVLVSAESGLAAIFICKDERVVDDNRGPELFGASRQRIIAELEKNLREFPLLREESTFHWHSERLNGVRFTIEAALSRIEVEGHVRLLAVLVDLSARKKTERTLAQLSGRLLQLQDEERQRVARQLHNETGQNLSALNINLSMILSSSVKLGAEVREALQESIDLADSCVREIRKLSYELHPPLLDELGLASALRAYAKGYSERTGIELNLSFPTPARRLPQPVEVGLFRIVEEGLDNIHRHSGSKCAILQVKQAADQVELELVDDGRGLPPGTLEAPISVGIAGMRERARQLGGRLTIASGPTGTTLHVAVPLETRKSKAKSAR